MRRRLILISSGVSLAMCIASADQWLHGSGRGFMLARESAVAPDGTAWRTEWSLGANFVGVAFGRFPPDYLFPLRERHRWQLVRWSPQYSSPRRMRYELLGFGWTGAHPRASRYGSVALPMWFVLALTAAGSLPFLLALRRGVYVTCRTLRQLPHDLRRSRWRRLGLCDGCGYDLTGNQSGVCSECGARVR